MKESNHRIHGRSYRTGRVSSSYSWIKLSHWELNYRTQVFSKLTRGEVVVQEESNHRTPFFFHRTKGVSLPLFKWFSLL